MKSVALVLGASWATSSALFINHEGVNARNVAALCGGAALVWWGLS